MQPLISQDLFEEFRAVRKQLAQRSDRPLSAVFVPVGPNKVDGDLRILFVGQATRGGISDDASYHDSARRCAADAAYFLNNAHGSFWHAVHTICQQVILTLNLRDDQRAEIVGWSNLTKIGFCTGDNQNPTAAVVGEQAALCVRSLHEEIMQFRPTATVLLTGDWSAKKILEPCFGPGEEWQNNVPSENRVAVKLHETCGPLLWTYHPRWMRTQKDLEVATTSFISGYIAGLVTGSRMTQIE